MGIDSVSTTVSQVNSSSYDDTNTRQSDIATWVANYALPGEVRIINSARGRQSGYYDDPEKLATDLTILSGLTEKGIRNGAVYMTVNPVKDDLLARSYNEMAVYAKVTTKDEDIVRRHWFPMDFDAGQACTGIMATDAQRAVALGHAHEVRDYLTDLGFPPPMFNDSGNGGHLLYRVNEPNTDEVRDVYKALLESLYNRFPDRNVDRTVFSAAQLLKVPGTMVCKGSEVPKLGLRYRASGILYMPAELHPVDLGLVRKAVEATAGSVTVSVPAARVAQVSPMAAVRAAQGGERFDAVAFMDRHGVGHADGKPEGDGWTKYVLDECPFDPSHLAPDAAVYVNADGRLGFSCFHKSCVDYHWAAFREHFEPMAERPIRDGGLDVYSDRMERMFGTERDVPVQTPAVTLPPSADATVAEFTPPGGIVRFEPTIQDQTDVGNAILFCERFGTDLRWVREWKKWIRWNGIYWQPVSAEAIIARYAQPMVRDVMPAMGKNIKDDDRRKKWFGWVAMSNSANKVRAMLDMAGPRLMVEVADLNKNAKLLATRNAVLNLDTCSRVEPNRDDFITVATPTMYDPSATCPAFTRFVEQIMVDDAGQAAPDVVDYLQRALGYCLTTSTREQVFFICHGTGKNGKSTLLEAVLGVLGEYGIQGSETLFLDSRDRTNNEDEARLYGKRLCVTAETKDSAYFNAPKIKRLTGADRVVASFKYERQFEFIPTHKLFLLCNHKPKFDPSDDAMVRRIKLVPFLHVVPEADRDANLPAKLTAEQPGILNWMLAGLARWNAGIGLGDDHTPAIMRAKKDTYLNENDDLGEFIEQHTRTGGEVSKDDLYYRYRRWAEESGKKPLAKNNLGTRLAARGWPDHRGALGVRYWSVRSLTPDPTGPAMWAVAS